MIECHQWEGEFNVWSANGGQGDREKSCFSLMFVFSLSEFSGRARGLLSRFEIFRIFFDGVIIG